MPVSPMAQELLTTFAEELGSVTLTPDRTGGVFEVRVDDEVIWSRKDRGRFPEIKEIKQLVRDRVVPGRPLGQVMFCDLVGSTALSARMAGGPTRGHCGLS